MERDYGNKTFWINMLEDKDKVILNKERILSLNRKNFNEPANGLNNLKKLSFSMGMGVVVKRTKVKKQPCDERIGEPLFDSNIESVLYPFEAVAILGISDNGKYYHIAGVSTVGYALCCDIAVTSSRNLWEYYLRPDKFYIVLNDDIKTPFGLPKLYMGTRIPLDKEGFFMIPAVEGAGVLAVEKIRPVFTKGFNYGYLEYTLENVISQAFSCIGGNYGWGGDFGGRDCSLFICDIMKTFGIIIGRNVENQLKSGVSRIDISNMQREGKELLIKKLPVGTVLSFKGHTAMYIGCVGGRPYIIHSLARYMGSSGKTENVMKVLVTDIDIRRVKNGYSFIESFTDAVLFS